MMAKAIKYQHFVQFNLTSRTIVWLATGAKGNYHIDEGGWRDYELLQQRGVEFELESDATEFLRYVGGVYYKREQ